MNAEDDRERIRKAMEERKRLQAEIRRQEAEKKRLEQQLKDKG